MTLLWQGKALKNISKELGGAMSRVQQLSQLARELVRCDEQPVLVAGQGLAFDVAPAAVPGYVQPSVTIEDWPDGATVLLMEAAGAVGKSAAALALAEALHCPLVRAERAQVGSHSLSGLIHDALGYTSSYIADLSTGTKCVVVDSLDEAHFRAGTENFLAFLENVQKVSGATPRADVTRRPSVVLFSRTDTAELVKLAFADAGLPLASAKIDFFDLAGAQRFIVAYMAQRFAESGRSEYNIPLGSPRPFEKLRDSRMRSVASVLLQNECTSLKDSWASIQDFLGYVPVLVALAESLAVPNPSAARHELEARDQSDLLEEIIEFILIRERGKLTEHLRPKLHALLPPEEDEDRIRSDLYSPVEQSVRLAAYVGGVDLVSTLPARLPSSVIPAYDESVSTFLPDHPFLKQRSFASVVFQDYVLAAACRELEARVALPVDPEELIHDVGPFFARFLANDGSDEAATIREGVVDHVLRSWAQESALADSSENEVRLQLFGDSGHLECLRKSDGASGEIVDLEFDIADPTGAIQLDRSLRDAVIFTDQGIILGSGGQHLNLGPNLFVFADELIIDAETIRVESNIERGSGVGLSATKMTANRLQRVEAGSTGFGVFTADPPPRLRAYRRELRIDRGYIPFQRFLDLRTILTAFRPSIRGGQAVLAAKLEGKIVGSNAYRTQILGGLEARGAVSHQGRWYYLDLNALDELGFGMHDLRSGEPGRAILGFLADCGCVQNLGDALDGA